MGYNKKYGCTYPTNSKQAAHMKMRKQQNLECCKYNKSENWAKHVFLKETSFLQNLCTRVTLYIVPKFFTFYKICVSC